MLENVYFKVLQNLIGQVNPLPLTLPIKQLLEA